MKALMDGDILRYEIGYGAETMAKGMDGPDAVPSWDMVESLLAARLTEIQLATASDEVQLYLTQGRTFRYDLAVSRPYKGTRVEKKPWHFDNLTCHMTNVLGAQVVQHVEADDQLALDHIGQDDTVLCSRDKDLRQVPGNFYSWELGGQPSFGPISIPKEGWLEYDKGKLSGCGYAFFCAQVLMGDITDNIPGLRGWGPKAAYDLLGSEVEPEALASAVEDAYFEVGEDYLLEQGRLCWITRSLHADGTPVLWEIGMTE